ncbi:OmpA family protein [Galbibacter pacificus]|uniref:OmpA family protein n=1 Tax=Galbibacter pacificus TaxID=2996052 RepID=A0ABT6FP71_9FLAO|nr:OmpA family protein [Galbibacter pacificus]MDG3581381.1 OmpA family protein [Galbibacter pacificus]MDG3584859.1 OmpA family protein [Galbibacter pacificus]
MKIRIVTSLFLIWMLSGQAQEIMFKLDGGTSGIAYNSSMGNGTLGFGGGIGVGYTYFFNNHWGLQTGIEARYNSNTFELYDNQQIVTNEIDDQGSAFEYRVNTSKYREDQHFYSFGIPVMLQYRGAISDKTGFYVGFGGKVLFPTKQQVAASAKDLELSSYYPDLNLEIDDLPVHGFGNTNDWENHVEVSLKTSVLLSIEGGLIFKLKEHLKLYTGIYIDYGLTDLQDENPTQNLVDYSPNGLEMVTANGVMAAEGIVESSKYLSVGIQVKLGFRLGKKNALQAEKTEVVTIEEPMETKVLVPKVVEKNHEENIIEPTLTASEVAYMEKPLVFGNIDQIEIPEQLTERLKTIARLANKNKESKLYITGYTCDLGSESINKKIGMKRARSVAAYLETQGISRDRMKVESKGEAEPLFPNITHKNREKNRRVSIEVVSEN